VWFFVGVLCGVAIAALLHAAGDADLEEELSVERRLRRDLEKEIKLLRQTRLAGDRYGQEKQE
jgi:hypothetical protein